MCYLQFFCFYFLCCSIFVIPAERVNQNSVIDEQKATASSIQAYHVVVTSLLGFFLGTLLGALIFHLCQRRRRHLREDREKRTLFEINTTTNIEVKSNDYLSRDDVIALPPSLSDECHTYSTLTFNTKAKDATLKRNASVQRSESLMRTKLDQPDAFWVGCLLNHIGFERAGFGKGWALDWWISIDLCLKVDWIRADCVLSNMHLEGDRFWTTCGLNKMTPAVIWIGAGWIFYPKSLDQQDWYFKELLMASEPSEYYFAGTELDE